MHKLIEIRTNGEVVVTTADGYHAQILLDKTFHEQKEYKHNYSCILFHDNSVRAKWFREIE